MIKKKSLAIIELNYHQELIYSLCRLFEDSDYTVTIFTLPEIYHEIAEVVTSKRFGWILIKEDESVAQFLSHCRKKINKHDIVLFNTIDREAECVASLHLKPYMILRVHNVNTFLNRSGHLIPARGIRSLLKNIYRRIREPERYKKLDSFLNQTDTILVPDETIAEYAGRQKLRGDFNLEVLPLSFFTKNKSDLDAQFHKANKRKIVIPGIIDSGRKDYETLAEALKMVEKELNEPIEIAFLGGLKHSDQSFVIEKFRAIESDKLKIFISERWIPQEKFVSLIEQAGFIIAPTKVDTTFKFFKEKYGQTKMSGAVSDVVRYGKPSIMPKAYQLNTTLAAQIEQYRSADELKALICRYLDSDYLRNKYETLWTSLEAYRIEYNLEKFNRIVDNA